MRGFTVEEHLHSQVDARQTPMSSGTSRLPREGGAWTGTIVMVMGIMTVEIDPEGRR